jgi:hypothetical protein
MRMHISFPPELMVCSWPSLRVGCLSTEAETRTASLAGELPCWVWKSCVAHSVLLPLSRMNGSEKKPASLLRRWSTGSRILQEVAPLTAMLRRATAATLPALYSFTEEQADDQPSRRCERILDFNATSPQSVSSCFDTPSDGLQRGRDASR